jgi:hypothetical protein
VDEQEGVSSTEFGGLEFASFLSEWCRGGIGVCSRCANMAETLTIRNTKEWLSDFPCQTESKYVIIS